MEEEFIPWNDCYVEVNVVVDYDDCIGIAHQILAEELGYC